MKQNQFGRSMIEMLGVLAIIAILSVGGIAGYSKAMEQFKINKTVEEYTYLMNGLLEHADSLKKSSSALSSLTNIASALNLIPSNWKQTRHSTIGPTFSDTFDNTIDIYKHYGNKYLVLEIYLTGLNKKSAYSTAVCSSLIQNFVKPLHSVWHHFWFWMGDDEKEHLYYYGDKYAEEGQKLIKDLEVVETQQICQKCQPPHSCSFVLLF